MPTMAEAREQLDRGETWVYYDVTLDEAWDDLRVREGILADDPRSFAAAELAERAGLDVELEVQEWDNGEIIPVWRVRAPDDTKLSLLVWDEKDGSLQNTLTHSTQFEGWQFTTWSSDGLPWGHTDLDEVSEAFDTSAMASGRSLVGLRQVVLADGTVLVREGSEELKLNPKKLKAKLLR